MLNGDKSVERVSAVIVTYFPCIESLKRSLRALRGQVKTVLIVDNGSPEESLVQLKQWSDYYRCELISLGANRGLAYAQNVGIDYIFRESVDYVIFFDQDSLATEGMVHSLMAYHEKYKIKGERVAAVGPLTADERTGHRGKFVNFVGSKIVQSSCANEGVVYADFLISSGCMISAEAIQSLGHFKSLYFIDHIDTEWCLRARLGGWVLLGICGEKLIHNLGDSYIRVWFGRWRNVAIHTPLRDYYFVRNTILLIYDLNLSWSLRFAFVKRMMLFSIFSILSSKPRLERLHMIVVGIIHGLRNFRGPFGAVVKS